ncbi:LacI family transcriptional regulator [Acidaminobacter sp. JC074]|uniref:LacI family DNA-binding transcriptional regulator n=1 Tax=Acidaminobacter sp. JC074 TaxID=2530199 RepID=UPI001F10EE8C|nr:LacI family DNA-binding transcriptional regulator [Acidaminobacter sp. JC074]MCH4888015.1 LacI family transcriptional regulator [Acidaminobacter sp. JC074]
MKKTSMTDIAKLAGVSVKTVSRVINGSSEVKPDTKKKIMEIIEKEGYVVNLAAQGLKGRKTKTIIVFIDTHGGSYWSIWHNEILNSIFKEAKKTGYKVVVSPSSATGVIGDETDGFYLLKARLADGAIIFDNKKDDIRLKYLYENNIPYVLVGKLDDDKSYYVDLDNYKAGFIGGEYLHKRGYKKIVQFVGSDDFIVNQERIKGFENALSATDVEHKTFSGVDSVVKAFEKAKQLLDEETIDAFFVSGDERAIGVYRAVHEKGLKIPEDIAILGIDNIVISEFLYPPLSTVDQDTSGLGKTALKTIVKQIKNEEVKQIQISEPKIIERESS